MRTTPAQAVVIGASAGAFDALTGILPNLPTSFPIPVIVVVHLPPDKHSLLSELFRQKCRLPVIEVEDGQPLDPGKIYFAPPDYHLFVEAGSTLSLSKDSPVLYSRPSIDVLFESACDVFGAELIAVILSGANEDGAAGSALISAAGGTVIVQDPDEALVSTMPEATFSRCPDAIVLSLQAIVQYLREV
ncbi:MULTISPECIES: chemotaxis protein CheB [Brucella/Ochrobactrum group]|jgi:two-component system chemotaxis response regulator CheB|uniref:chemotaxis protein CheB n=1 Tax=Brucella/Ochrobactrum group TaxID=2826938 RepID=UPI001C042019|nr:chemotaxis protein CheB [Brucella sp. NBRC 12950]QWK81204.1 chemotaxis protein CheB [Ochrobactrum sp. BTU1]GLU28199.1 chemotaxis protein CheB [Brucella sp. NBRC 12950]